MVFTVRPSTNHRYEVTKSSSSPMEVGNYHCGTIFLLLGLHEEESCTLLVAFCLCLRDLTRHENPSSLEEPGDACAFDLWDGHVLFLTTFRQRNAGRPDT